MGKAANRQVASSHEARTGRWQPRRWVDLGLDLVFPPLCASCHDSLEPGLSSSLCPACRSALTELGPSCPRCGAPIPSPSDHSDCARCRDERFHFRSVARLGIYEGQLREAVLRVKSPRQRPLAVALGNLLAKTAGSILAGFDLDVVVPVPMHWTRRVWRGANSPDAIAQQLAFHLDVPMRRNLLARRRRTAPQASLSPVKRRSNVRGAFRAVSHPDLFGARVLLVDDIMTTGATVNEAAKTLSRAGADLVAVVVLARAPGAS